MNFILFNVILLFTGFLAVVIFSVGLMACLAPMALFAKSKTPPKAVEPNRYAGAGQSRPPTFCFACALPSGCAASYLPDSCCPVGTRGCATNRRVALNALRRRLLDDLHLRGRAPKPQPGSRAAVNHLALHDRRPPDQRSEAALRQYFRPLINAKPVAERTRRIPLDGIRFLDERTLPRPWPVFDRMRPRKRRNLPVVLSVQEGRPVLGLVHHRKAHRCLRLISAWGVRMTAGTRLQGSDSAPARLLVRVANGQGGTDRCVPRAPRLLEW